jgi:dTDP-4-dehydrorhamnose 3,5-epimerase
LQFNETILKGAFVIQPEKKADDRGFFARVYCDQEFAARGLETKVVQCSISFSPLKGTLRGMHYQVAPFEECKLVRCTMGAILDVLIDLRPESPTYKKSFSVVLSAENRKLTYIPHGFAHGFQTLEDNAEVCYQISQFFSGAHSRGVRWNDPQFQIEWPERVRIMSNRDKNYPDFCNGRD